MANLTDADKVLRNDTGKSIVSKLDGIKDAIVAQGGGAHSLDQLSDVDIDSQTLAAGQSIVYNDVTEKFENGEVSTVAALNDLTDVSITSAAAGDSLRNDGNGNWVNEPTTVAMTQDDWDDIQDKASWRNAHKNTHLVLTDAPNLNATSEDLSYDGGATSTHDEVESVKISKADKSSFAKKSYTTTTAINIGANTIDTQSIAIYDATYGIVVGFAITNNTDVVIMQCYFNSTTELVLRVRNVSSSAGTYKFSVIYI